MNRELRLFLFRRRAALLMSQRELAQRMGTTQSAVSDLESGLNDNPTIDTLCRWTSSLELSDPYIEINGLGSKPAYFLGALQRDSPPQAPTVKDANPDEGYEEPPSLLRPRAGIPRWISPLTTIVADEVVELPDYDDQAEKPRDGGCTA